MALRWRASYISSSSLTTNTAFAIGRPTVDNDFWDSLHIAYATMQKPSPIQKLILHECHTLTWRSRATDCRFRTNVLSPHYTSSNPYCLAALVASPATVVRSRLWCTDRHQTLQPHSSGFAGKDRTTTVEKLQRRFQVGDKSWSTYRSRLTPGQAGNTLRMCNMQTEMPFYLSAHPVCG